MNISKEIKKMMIERGIGQVELATKLGISQSNLAQRLKRNNFNTNDLTAITTALNYELKIEFIKKEDD